VRLQADIMRGWKTGADDEGGGKGGKREHMDMDVCMGGNTDVVDIDLSEPSSGEIV
jgi:hypothetical protein